MRPPRLPGFIGEQLFDWSREELTPTVSLPA
jgi:hypothetical protein